VFDHVAVWSVNRQDLLLLGFRDPESALNLVQIEQRFARADFRAAFEPLKMPELAQLLAHETLPVGVVNAAGLQGPLHTLYHPRLAFEAGRAFLVGGTGWLPFTGYGEAARVGADHSLLHRYLASFGDAVPEPILGRVTEETCRNELSDCPARATAWYRQAPRSPRLERFLAAMPGGDGPVLVRELAWFLEPAPPEGAPRIRPRAALHATRRFLEYYAHSLPFDPVRLLDFWQRCGGGDAGVARCAPGLRNAERLVAGVAPPEASSWLVREPAAEAPGAAHSAQHRAGERDAPAATPATGAPAE
jgi:hypothetical protein